MSTRKKPAAETALSEVATVAEFEQIASQIKDLERVLAASKEAAIRMIAQKTAEANAALEDAMKISKLANVEFSFTTGDYTSYFKPENGYWTNSSYYC